MVNIVVVVDSIVDPDLGVSISALRRGGGEVLEARKESFDERGEM